MGGGLENLSLEKMLLLRLRLRVPKSSIPLLRALDPLPFDPFHCRAPRKVDWVDSPLVQVDEEHDVVAEARQPVHPVKKSRSTQQE